MTIAIFIFIMIQRRVYLDQNSAQNLKDSFRTVSSTRHAEAFLNRKDYSRECITTRFIFVVFWASQWCRLGEFWLSCRRLSMPRWRSPLSPDPCRHIRCLLLVPSSLVSVAWVVWDVVSCPQNFSTFRGGVPSRRWFRCGAGTATMNDGPWGSRMLFPVACCEETKD